MTRRLFYAESGGQVGDGGVISADGFIIADGRWASLTAASAFEVGATKKLEGFHLHNGQVTNGVFAVGENYYLEIFKENRFNTRKNHSATHLLQASLQKVLGTHVKQAGSLVGTEKLRFDFNHFNALSKEEIEEVEKRVNEVIWKNHPVHISQMPMKKALSRGAIAFFEEKYGDVVRVIDMGTKLNPYSIELCGGSHVRTTGEIGLFKILMESSVASGIRRIEATTR